MDKQKSFPSLAVAIIGGAVLALMFFLYVAIRLAMRDAANGVDFFFKAFGAFAAFIFAFFGPIGVIGFTLMRGGNLGNFGNIIYRLIFAGIATVVLTAYVMYKFGAWSVLF